MVKLYNHPEVSQMVSPFERTDSEGIQAEKKQIELLEQYLEKKRQSLGLSKEEGSTSTENAEVIIDAEDFHTKTESEGRMSNYQEVKLSEEKSLASPIKMSEEKRLALNLNLNLLEERKEAVDRAEKHVESILNGEELVNEFDNRMSYQTQQDQLYTQTQSFQRQTQEPGLPYYQKLQRNQT